PIAGPDGSNWRLSFVIVAVPAFVLVIVLLLTVKEPPRGTMEAAFREKTHKPVDYKEKLSLDNVKILLRTPTFWLILAQGVPGSLPWGIALSFLTDFVIETKNVPRAESGLVVLGFGVGAAAGQVFGGWIADKYHERKKMIPIIMSTTTALGALPFYGLVNLPPQSVLTYLLFGFPAGALAGVTGASVRVVLLHVTDPITRGTASSIFTWFDEYVRDAFSSCVSCCLDWVADVLIFCGVFAKLG
ncbi:Synaptic vesicle glycoprotein 2A, partial [Durusdinium trenchii]